MKQKTSFVNKFDMYGKQPPQLNLEGRTQITSYCGLIMTNLTLILMVAFAIVKITESLDGRQTIITQFDVESGFKIDDPLDLKESHD